MGWPHNAYIGQKVVRFRDFEYDPSNLIPMKVPQLNEIITISHVSTLGDRIVLDFIEYEAPENEYFYKGWASEYFRPVQSTDKGMEVLRGLLNPINHKVLENA